MPSFRNGLLLCTTPMLLAQAALAQSNSCELLKQTLASRIPPEIRGYAMDDVPSKTPVPPGGKVIGTCEGGARKVIYRRYGGAPLTGEASAPASATQASAPAPKPVASAPAPVVVQKEAPKPKVEPVVPPKPVTPPAASAPAVTPPKPVASAPVAPPPARPAPVVASAPIVPAKPVVIEKRPEPAEPPAPPAPAMAEATDDTPGFFSTYGRWLWLLLALPLAGLAWAWVSHRMSYDSAGLPRGPRL